MKQQKIVFSWSKVNIQNPPVLNDLVHTGIYTTRSIKLYQNAHVHAHVNIISQTWDICHAEIKLPEILKCKICIGYSKHYCASEFILTDEYLWYLSKLIHEKKQQQQSNIQTNHKIQINKNKLKKKPTQKTPQSLKRYKTLNLKKPQRNG